MAEEKQYIYAEAANGLTVRIPADRYDSWKKTQDSTRAGTYKRDPQMLEQLRSLMKNKK